MLREILFLASDLRHSNNTLKNVNEEKKKDNESPFVSQPSYNQTQSPVWTIGCVMQAFLALFGLGL